MRNVYWFLIDGLSPDYLNSCGHKNIEKNFFDELIEKGFIFTNVVSTNGGTHTSMHSIFSSMYSSVNGASGWSEKALRSFKPDIFTLTDFFKMNKYTTFRYCDALNERVVPKSGFDIWESSGVNILNLLDETDNTDTARRRKFVEIVNNCTKSKFIYHHCFILHQLNARLGAVWSSEGYINNIKRSAEIFRHLYNSYKISSEDIVILSSDHGVILDKDYISDGEMNGERQYEQSVKTFFSMLGDGIPQGRFDGLISSIDEAPTIADYVLNFKMPGQGISRVPLMKGSEYIETVVFREKGTYCNEKLRNPFTSDVFYVRQGNWKYVYSTVDARSEWLINLDEGDYCINHLDDIDRINYFRELINRTFFAGITPEVIYKKYGFGLKKKDLDVKFSIIIDNKDFTEEVSASLADLGGPYYEVIVLNCERAFQRYSFRSYSSGLDDNLMNYVRGTIIVYLKGKHFYSEYLLSDLNLLTEKKIDGSLLVFKTGFAVLRSQFKDRKKLTVRKVTIREIEIKEKQKFKKVVHSRFMRLLSKMKKGLFGLMSRLKQLKAGMI